MQWTIGKGASKPQNSPEKTSKKVFSDISGDNQTDAGLEEEAKRQKKILPKNRLYSDQAIAVAKAAVKGAA